LEPIDRSISVSGAQILKDFPMLANCPNSTRLLRLRNFGKQKFSGESPGAQGFGVRILAVVKKNPLQRVLNNVLYRWQYILGADFAKNATWARSCDR
jgi:hypothetical protein